MNTNDQSPEGLLSPEPPTDPVAQLGASSEEELADMAAFLANAHEKVNAIEQNRRLSEGVRVDLESLAASARATLGSIQQTQALAQQAATEANSLLSAAQATNNQTSEFKAQASAAALAMQTILDSANSAAGTIESARVDADQTQRVIATKSAHIEAGREHCDKVRASIDRLLTEAQASATSTDAHQEAAQATMEKIGELHAAAQATKATLDSVADSAAETKGQCERDVAATKALASIADKTQERVSSYEKRLALLEQACDVRLKTIDSLLPGATSAGLASAFGHRKGYYKWPQRLWQALFVGCLLGLLGLVVLEFGLLTGPDSDVTWERLGLSFLHRLPYAAPLVWLALHASHKGALAQRVEEDYAFKEAVSRSFEGFRKEMSELEGKTASDSALSTLCASVLRIITSPPGRVYEKHPLNKTPLSVLAESASPLAEAARKVRE